MVWGWRAVTLLLAPPQVDIMVGQTSMRVYPQEYESTKDIMVWNDQKEQENAKACVDNTPPQLEAVA